MLCTDFECIHACILVEINEGRHTINTFPVNELSIYHYFLRKSAKHGLGLLRCAPDREQQNSYKYWSMEYKGDYARL